MKYRQKTLAFDTASPGKSARRYLRARSHGSCWILCAFSSAVVLAVGVIAELGPTERGLHSALEATARLAFLLFWPAYSAGALVVLFGDAFERMKRHARGFGLAFAAVLFVHLGVVGWLCAIGAAPGPRTFAFFGIGAVLAYTLAAFSVDSIRERLGAKRWSMLSKISMNYIVFAFFVDFARQPLTGDVRHVLEYVPFVVLSVAGPALRLAAFALRIRRDWPYSPN